MVMRNKYREGSILIAFLKKIVNAYGSIEERGENIYKYGNIYVFGKTFLRGIMRYARPDTMQGLGKKITSRCATIFFGSYFLNRLVLIYGRCRYYLSLWVNQSEAAKLPKKLLCRFKTAQAKDAGVVIITAVMLNVIF